MRKIKLLFAVALSMIAWTSAMATVTQPTLTTDPSNPVLYTIKSLRTGKYATYTGASSQLSQEAAITKASIWYFEENGEGVNIIPAKEPSVKLAGHSSATETGAVWYLVENPYRAGYFCVTLSNNASSNCWDDQGNQTKIGYWQPSANDNQGTSWIIEPFDLKNPVEVTYELFDGGTKISSTTVLQEANSAPANPLPGTGINYNGFFHEKFYYDYAVSGTIGDTDCTITITRTEKAGVVKALSDLSNNKAYYIGCDRGAMIAYNGKMINTALNDATVNAQPLGKFALINYEDNYYIFSVDEGKFIKNDASVALDLTTVGFSTEDAMKMTKQDTAPYFLWTFNAKDKYLNTNGNQPLGYVINSYSTPDPGNLYYMVEAGDFDPTAALAELDAYFHPSYFVTYVVKDNENGKVLFTSEPQPTKKGAKITTLLGEFQRPYYTYSEADVTISDLETTVEFRATWTGPFKLSTNFENAQWQNMAMRGTWYVTSDKKDDDGAYKTQNANTMGLVEDSYQWAFIGNGYDGFKIINKASGDGKSFGWTDATATNAGIPTIMPDGEGHHAWKIVASTNSKVPAGSFCLNVPGTDLYINQYGGAGGSVKFWNSTNNLGDDGSAFTVFDVPTNFASFVKDEIAPTMEATGYFAFNDATKAAVGYNESYKTECSFAQYKEMKTVMEAKLENIGNYNLPETGYYILKNKNYGTYMGIDPSDANMYGNYAAAKAAKQIVKLTKTGEATYTISLMGKFAPATVAQSKPVTASTEAGTYTVVINTLGYAAFQADPAVNMSCLHCRAAGDIVGWEAPADASKWEVIDATSIEFTVGETGYATAYLPFPVENCKPLSVPAAKGTWTFDDGTTGSLEATAGVTIANGVATVPAGEKKTGDYLTMSTGVESLSTYSIMFDVKTGNAANYCCLFNNDLTKDGSLFFNKNKAGLNCKGLGYNGTINNDQWYRVVFVSENAYAKLYVDGVLVGQSTQGADEDHWKLGSNLYFFGDDDGEETEVEVDELRFWDQALTASEVANLGSVGSKVPEKEIAAYTAVINQTWLDLVPVVGTIPATTAVVLKGEPAIYVFNVAAETAAIADNVLKGTLEPIDATGKYVLAKPEGEKVGFYQAESGKIAAGKAYLEVPAAGGVKGFFFAEDNANAIANVNVNDNDNQAVIYNVAGQRLSKMQKGINIVNGKKVLK